MNSASNDTQSNYSTGNIPSNWADSSSTIFVPTAVQLERANALKRFNRWVIYVPLGFLVTAVLGLLVYLLYLAIWPPYEDTRLFLSGIADIILILFLLPLALIFGLLLVGIFGGVIYWRQSRKEEGEQSLSRRYGRLRLLLWKVDQKLSTLARQIDQSMPKIANPIIRLNSFIAYLNTGLAQLTRQLKLMMRRKL